MKTIKRIIEDWGLIKKIQILKYCGSKCSHFKTYGLSTHCCEHKSINGRVIMVKEIREFDKNPAIYKFPSWCPLK